MSIQDSLSTDLLGELCFHLDLLSICNLCFSCKTILNLGKRIPSIWKMLQQYIFFQLQVQIGIDESYKAFYEKQRKNTYDNTLCTFKEKYGCYYFNVSLTETEVYVFSLFIKDLLSENFELRHVGSQISDFKVYGKHNFIKEIAERLLKHKDPFWYYSKYGENIPTQIDLTELGRYRLRRDLRQKLK